jgi:hypothetical protein
MKVCIKEIVAVFMVAGMLLMNVIMPPLANAAVVVVNYSLTVTVLDATSNDPIVGAAVQAIGPGTYSGSTDGNGQIIFNSVQPGSYQVTASAPGYSPSTVTVSVTSSTAVTIRLSSPTVGGEVEPVNIPIVLLAAVEGILSEYWMALLAVGAIAALIIFKRRRK